MSRRNGQERSQAANSEGADHTPDHENEVDTHRNPPQADLACLYGIVGDVAHAGSDSTEANPYAIAANFIAYLSCAIGRGPYLPVGNTWHHARLFILHIGRSGRGRKGDAVSLVTRLDRAIRQLNERAAPQIHRGGLSSREGLVSLIHDGYKQGKQSVDAIDDKRLWVIESEFANILQQGRREGNTLSSALRDCWDGVCMKPATKSNRLYASHPHVCLSGAITPTELLGMMNARELTNGFANRFLMIWAERTKVIPFPVTTPQQAIDNLAIRVMKILEFVQAERCSERDHMRVQMTPDAQMIYAQLYCGELNENSAGERVTAVLERRAPMLLRLSMLFALCDLQTHIGAKHIHAAMAWIRYSAASVKFVFFNADDEVARSQTNETVMKIVDFLAARGKATRREITIDCFNGHQSKAHIDEAIDHLLNTTPPQIQIQIIERPKDAPGTATKVYSLRKFGSNLVDISSPVNGSKLTNGIQYNSGIQESKTKTTQHSSQSSHVQRASEIHSTF
jgi:hypothetical protein